MRRVRSPRAAWCRRGSRTDTSPESARTMQRCASAAPLATKHPTRSRPTQRRADRLGALPADGAGGAPECNGSTTSRWARSPPTSSRPSSSFRGSCAGVSRKSSMTRSRARRRESYSPTPRPSWRRSPTGDGCVPRSSSACSRPRIDVQANFGCLDAAIINRTVSLGPESRSRRGGTEERWMPFEAAQDFGRVQ